jgi:Mce-associated membrane protein
VPSSIWPLPQAVIAALAAVALILVGAVVWLALLVQGQHARNSDRDSALAAARQAATDFATYDYQNVDKQFAHLATESTGAMKTQVQQSQQSVVPLIKQGKATAKGQVRDAAVAAAHSKEISIVAVVDESVTNTSIPKGALRRYRFLLVMTQVHGRWLVSSLEQA